MFVCAILSMWMTNTSTTMMLLPIVLSVASVIRDNVPDISDKTRNDFQIAMLLGLAYSASIGGLATIIGTPPNALLMAFIAENYDIEISFARWMMIGIPVTFTMLPIAWIGLTRFLFPCDIPASDSVRNHLHHLREELGEMSPSERRVLLFLLPSGEREDPRLMAWEDVTRLPWGVLVLFGGGLSLAAVVSDTGLALWLGQQLAPLNAWGTAVLVIASVAVQAGVPPIVLTVPITIAASCAFMLPVATPPNAIVFSTGAISIPQMVRAGVFLNLIGIAIVSIVSLTIAPALLQ